MPDILKDEEPQKLLPKVWTDKLVLERAYQFVKEQLSKSYTDHQSREQKWLEWDKCYRLIDERRNDSKYGCRVVDPEPQVEVETLKANIVEAFLAQDPAFKYQAMEETDDTQAEIMTAYRADHLRRIGLRDKFERSIHQLLVYGTCIVKTPWKKEVDKRRVRVRVPQKDRNGFYKFNKSGERIYRIEEKVIDVPKIDDTDWEYVSLFDFYVCGSGSDIQTVDGVIHKVQKSYDDLKANERKTETVDGEEVTKGIYYNLDSISVSAPKFDVAEYWGLIPKYVITGKEEDRFINFEGVISCVMKFENIGEEELKRQHAEKTGEIYEAEKRSPGSSAIRCQENPFWGGERPFLASPYTPVDNEFYGVGMIEPIIEKWHELNTTIRQLSDNKTIQLLMPMIEDVNANVQRDLMLTRNPRIKSDDINGIKPLPLSDFSANGWRMVAAIKDDMRRASGALESIQGTPLKSDTSATEFASIAQQAGVRLKNRIKLIDERLFKAFLTRAYEYDQQFAEFERIVRVLGRKGTDFKRVRPQDIWGTFDIVTQGPTQIENNVMMTNKLINFLSITARLPGVVNVPELVRKIWIKMGFPESEADDIVSSPQSQNQLMEIEMENKAMAFAQPTAIHNDDDHQSHFRGHTEAMKILDEMGRLTPEAEDIFKEHLFQHYLFLKQNQASANQLAQNGGLPYPSQSVSNVPQPNPVLEVPQ